MSDLLQQSAFMKACRGEATDYTPIWLNRQAGRYMPEYHQVKGNTPSLDFFKTPHLAAQATYMVINAAVEGIRLSTEGQIHQLIPG